MINMDTEKDYGEAHLNPLQRQNMRIFIEATKSLMDSVGEEGLSIRKIAAKAGYNSATIYNYFQDLDELMLFGSVSFFGSLSNFGVLKCLCTPGEDMH